MVLNGLINVSSTFSGIDDVSKFTLLQEVCKYLISSYSKITLSAHVTCIPWIMSEDRCAQRYITNRMIFEDFFSSIYCTLIYKRVARCRTRLTNPGNAGQLFPLVHQLPVFVSDDLTIGWKKPILSQGDLSLWHSLCKCVYLGWESVDLHFTLIN